MTNHVEIRANLNTREEHLEEFNPNDGGRLVNPENREFLECASKCRPDIPQNVKVTKNEDGSIQVRFSCGGRWFTLTPRTDLEVSVNGRYTLSIILKDNFIVTLNNIPTTPDEDGTVFSTADLRKWNMDVVTAQV